MARLFVLALISLILSFRYSIAQEKMDMSVKTASVETIHQLDSVEQILDATKKLELTVDRMSRQKISDCMRAFGNQKFCQCLADKSPIGIDLVGYITVVISTKDALGYPRADQKAKRLIDNTLKARETCVGVSKF